VKGACPCGRPASYESCCGRYIADLENTPAPDAESLMRSRYCAYVLGNTDYLFATWEAAHRPADFTPDAHAKWLGLEVRSRSAIDPTHAEVEFVARYRPSAGSGQAVRLHERSRFVHENGRWFYVDGDML
jgi:SEC-C motif-containing protein